VILAYILKNTRSAKWRIRGCVPAANIGPYAVTAYPTWLNVMGGVHLDLVVTINDNQGCEGGDSNPHRLPHKILSFGIPYWNQVFTPNFSFQDRASSCN